jgi:type IV conjugative transfer system coupling protein TraD
MTAPVSDVKNYTRGGQITLHNIRMFLQITNKVILIAGIIFLLVSGITLYTTLTDYEGYILSEYLWGQTLPLLDANASTNFINPNGHKVRAKYSDIVEAPYVKQQMHQINRKILRAIFAGLFVVLLACFGISKWLKKRGQTQTENILIKGDSISSTEATKDLLIRKGLASDLILGGLPMVKGKETSHILFHGTIGSGKSTAMKELLDQIRRRGDRAIIYDKGCNFLEEFYIPNYDVLLNPMDTRGESWDLWRETRDSPDFDSLAAAQIPMPPSTQDPFWINAARTIFAAAAFEMRNDPNRSVIKLLQHLLTAELDILQDYLKGTEAETLVSEKIEKTAISIKSVLATYLKSMKYIKDDGNPFSIRQWVQSTDERNFLFITSQGDRHETMKPLITAWIDIAVNALLSLPSSNERRIWILLDEVTSVNQLPSLKSGLSEGRKFGACFVLGVQNYAQLGSTYGQDGATDISSLINTRFMFRQPDAKIAKWSAENCGEKTTEEVRESISYGANTIRDGISINRSETTKPVVSYSEIMSLGDLQAYVRLPGKYPITPVNFNFKNREKRNAGFIKRKFDEKNMKSMDELIEKCEKPGINYASNKKKNKNQKIEVNDINNDIHNINDDEQSLDV